NPLSTNSTGPVCRHHVRTNQGGVVNMRTKLKGARAALSAALVAALGIGISGCSTTTDDGGDRPFYEGKTITLLVPFAPGGSADTTPRLFAPLLSEFIEGNPTVIVENRGGVGSNTGTKYFANEAPRDGTVVLVSSGSTHAA